MSQLFNKMKVASSNRNTFDLSHHQVTSSDFGYLIPICVRRMVPNDDFVVNPLLFTRLAPMSSPTYGTIKCRVHSFFVPYRILYPRWDAFINNDPSNYTIPPYFTVATLRQALSADKQMNPNSGTVIRGTFARLMANLGLNPETIYGNSGLLNTDRLSAFPFLAYYRIWLDWFADASLNDHPSLVESFNSKVESGGSMAANTEFLYTKNCCYKKDYFTTARVSPQDGDPSKVGVDLATDDLNPGLHVTTAANIASNGSVVYQNTSSGASSGTSKIGQFTIEALRAANSLQRYLERNNFVGSKLINRLLVHFGVEPSAERLDMAEWIGGNDFDIRIGDVTSTFSYLDASTKGVGFKAGQGVGSGNGGEVRYHAKEHGIFMTLLSIVPDTGYYQGISRHWFHGVTGDPLDFFTPEFENLGYQEILNKEVYVPNDSTAGEYDSYQPDGIFGYTPRYSEYKFQQDVLAGDFIGNIGGNNAFGSAPDTYHLFRTLYYDDENPLALNENFVELDNHNNDYDRIFQFTQRSYDHFYFNIFCDVKATRPMSGFGEPSLWATNEGDGRTINVPYGGSRL